MTGAPIGAPVAGVGSQLPPAFPPHTSYSDRQISPEETWGRIAPQMTRFGITRLSRLTGLDRLGIPVWNAVMPNARSIVINQGKGIRDIDAKVSAAMESLERAVAADPPLTPRLATAAQLRAEGENPQKLPALIGASASDIHKDEMIAWVDGVDLLTEKRVMVPFDAVVLDRVTDDHRF